MSIKTASSAAHLCFLLALFVSNTSSAQVWPGIQQQAYLKASNSGIDDSFGMSVAMSGDTLVVGAINEDGLNGAAYVFVRTAGVWSQQAYLNASNAQHGDHFGISVAISGNTVVVGAYHEDSDATGVDGDESNDDALGSGAAYVFTRTGSDWSQQAYLKASNTQAGDSFGESVSISGDTVVVAAMEKDDQAGAAYVFTRTDTSWSQQAYLKASNTQAGDKFGKSVALSDDTLVVGAYFEDSSATVINGDETDDLATSAGAAYVFIRTETTWSQQAYLKASNAEAGNRFGWSAAISGESVVIGATNKGADFAGAAYVFNRSGTSWSEQAYLQASNAGYADFLGTSVSISGDTLVVSAYSEDSNSTGIDKDGTNNDAKDSGSAYIFTRTGTDWSQFAYLKASNTEESDRFGWSATISGDTAVIGAIWEDSNAKGVNGSEDNASARDSGAAYAFKLSAFREDLVFKDSFEDP